VEFRKLNEKTVKDIYIGYRYIGYPRYIYIYIGYRYPMPVITDVLDKLGNSTYFSALDLARAVIKSKWLPKT